jgi:hypothetical protein
MRNTELGQLLLYPGQPDLLSKAAHRNARNSFVFARRAFLRLPVRDVRGGPAAGLAEQKTWN